MTKQLLIDYANNRMQSKLKTINQDQRLVNKRGSSIIEILVAVSVSLVMMLGVLSIHEQVLKVERKAQVVATMAHLRDQFVGIYSREKSWLHNFNLPANGMKCGRLATDPQCPDGEEDIRLVVDANNKDFFKAQVPNIGFTLSGLPCENFDSLANDLSCPIRWDIKWKRLCPPSVNCAVAPIEIVGKAVINQRLLKVEPALRLAGFNFRVVRPIEGQLSLQYRLPLNYLKNFNNLCNDCGASSKVGCESACNRFCGEGCLSYANCPVLVPGLKYTGGMLVECDATTVGAVCLCNP